MFRCFQAVKVMNGPNAEKLVELGQSTINHISAFLRMSQSTDYIDPRAVLRADHQMG